MDLKKIGEFIRKYRKDKKLSQSELAELSGFSLRSIQSWERGETSIDLINFAKLMNVLGRSIFISESSEELK